MDERQVNRYTFRVKNEREEILSVYAHSEEEARQKLESWEDVEEDDFEDCYDFDYAELEEVEEDV